MNDKNIINKKNKKKNYLSLYFIILIPPLLGQIPDSTTATTVDFCGLLQADVHEKFECLFI